MGSLCGKKLKKSIIIQSEENKHKIENNTQQTEEESFLSNLKKIRDHILDKKRQIEICLLKINDELKYYFENNKKNEEIVALKRIKILEKYNDIIDENYKKFVKGIHDVDDFKANSNIDEEILSANKTNDELQIIIEIESKFKFDENNENEVLIKEINEKFEKLKICENEKELNEILEKHEEEISIFNYFNNFLFFFREK